MANSFLGYQNPTSIDKKLDSESLVVGANTVERERIQIAGSAASDIAPVSATDGLLVNLGANNDVTVAGVSTAAKQDIQTAELTAIKAAVETAVELIDDTVKVLGSDTYTEAVTKGNLIGAVRRDTNTSLVDNTNEIAPPSG
jgi:hypothetical protein